MIQRDLEISLLLEVKQGEGGQMKKLNKTPRYHIAMRKILLRIQPREESKSHLRSTVSLSTPKDSWTTTDAEGLSLQISPISLHSAASASMTFSPL